MAGPDDELKELGDTFDELLGRLDATFLAQRQFVANASHELRTPLARQRTLLEVALRDPQATSASLRDGLRTGARRGRAAGTADRRAAHAGPQPTRPGRIRAVRPGRASRPTRSGARRDEADARGVNVNAELDPAPALGEPARREPGGEPDRQRAAVQRARRPGRAHRGPPGRPGGARGDQHRPGDPAGRAGPALLPFQRLGRPPGRRPAAGGRAGRAGARPVHRRARSRPRTAPNCAR